MKLKPARKKSSDPMLQIAAYNRESEDEKRPQEKLVKELYLDPRNPRLAEIDHTGTQASILKAMETHFDLQPLIDSMMRNGFFWEEPLVTVVEPLAELKNKEVLLVIEGNRRLAALKLIHSEPTVYTDKAARDRLLKVPVIIRDKREETLAFVGFRHITGIVPWESAAKAQYAHDLVTKGLTLEQISQTIGDKTQDIERWVRTQSIVEHARAQGLREDDAEKKFYFSYLLTSTDSPATKRFLEMKVDERKGTVKSINAERLEELWSWLYGSKSQQQGPVVPESRQIHKLNKVLSTPRAIQELQKTRNLERALIETMDRGQYVVQTLGQVRSLLQELVGTLAAHSSSEAAEEKSRFREAKVELERIGNLLSTAKASLNL